jgi:pimeloyl-ACP methyl ester carboxylesterase
VTRHPILVEVDGAHVAAVVTVPEGDARGIVLTLAGTGRHNLIGSALGAQLAPRLAEQGLASIRIDYAGVGDSPGLVPSWTLSDVSAAVRQVGAVLEVTSQALGVDRFASVGTCYGSRVALSLLSKPSCRGTVCLAPPVLDDGGLVRLGADAGRHALVSFVRSHGVLRRPASRLRRLLRPRRTAPTVASAFEHLDNARIVFLYGDDPEQDHYSSRARELLDSSLSARPPVERERFELRMLPCGPLSTFEILSPAAQTAVLGTVVDHVCMCFGDVLAAQTTTGGDAGR